MPKLLSVIVLCTAAFIVARPLCAAEQTADRPNFVMIISDDQAWNDYSFMGHRHIQTPHLDKLAKESATFTRGYVPSSLCRPSLMTMVTGLYPHQNGIAGNDPAKGTNRNLMLKHIKAAPSLPRTLQKLGYKSLQTGKWWEGAPALGGFTSAMTHGDTTRGGRHGDVGLKIGRDGLQPVKDFIEDCDGDPFFIWYAPFMPHTPHKPPQRLLKKYTPKVDSPFVARYYAMCEWFDETVGELLAHLEEKKLTENTVVMYVTDNGWIQQQRSGRYAPRSKRSPYDGGIRTPIMVKWPGKITPRMDKQTLVSSIDLAPTILSICGLKPDAKMQGVNLLPACQGQALDRQAIYGEIFAHDQANIDNPTESLLHRWVIDKNLKLITHHGSDKTELFDIVADPFEKNDLSAKQPETVQRLRKKLDAWWKPEA